VGGDEVLTVYFIGAGPGAPDLITVRGQRLLSRCPVCLFAGSIMPEHLLALCPPDTRVVDTGALTLEQIVTEIADANAAGHDVARLHSGDPSLYSALAEQCRRLDALGIGYEIVPGVPAFAAAAAALGRELTVPGVAQTVTLTRIATLSTPLPPAENLTSLARSGATLVLHLSAAQIDAIVPQLLAGGYKLETAAAVVAFASWPQQTVLRGTLADIAGQMHDAVITKTAVIVVGDVLTAEGFTDSYLYSAGRAREAASHHPHRPRKSGNLNPGPGARPASSSEGN
jgi:precorrin-4/cobalt-precorrin-4 C11-methyltransferase